MKPDSNNQQERVTNKDIVLKKFETPAKTLELLVDLQNILTTNRSIKKMMIGYNDVAFKQNQSIIWFEEDEKVLKPLLEKLLYDFDLNSIGIIQKAAPGYNNEYIVTKKSKEDEYANSLKADLEHCMEEIDEKNQDIDSILRDEIYREKELVSSSFGPVVLPCRINNNSSENLNVEALTFGFLGLIPTQQQLNNDLVKLITMIANQLGLYFGHLNLTRRKALKDRLIKTIEAIDTRLGVLNPDGNTQILEDLAVFISEVFDQHAGAIYTYIKDENVLEKTASLDPWTADLVSTEDLFANLEIMNVFKKADTLDNTNKKVDLPIRYVFPLTSTFANTKYSMALVIYESELNPMLSRDEKDVISDRLTEKIGFHLQAAENLATRISSISKYEDLIKNISNPSIMQDKMIKVISDHLKVDIISYMEVDPTRKYLILKKGQGHSETVVPNETKQLIDDSISGLVVKYGRTLYITNIKDLDEVQRNFPEESRENLERLFCEQHETSYHTKSLLSVPLITGKGTANRKVTGVINVNNKDNKKAFTLSDKKFLESISNLVATGIDNFTYLSETKERELLNKNAREIQMSLMPTETDFNRLPAEIDMYGESIPAKEVGGDLFETVRLRDGRLLVILGDVSGKGSSAAIIMAIAQTVIKTLAPEESNIISILKKANKYLSEEMEGMDGKFVTLQLVAINVSTGECEFASAGHGPLFIRRQNNNEEIPPNLGMPLGLFDPPLMKFESINFKLNPGDLFVMFTDGLYEEINHSNEMFGTDRVKKIMTETAYESSKKITKELVTACQNWREGADAHDDLTVLTVKYRGKIDNE
ncbi:MAG: SpoIIE family protein phosphatase [Candidatus Riflebacteria bacterium]|nr:SpoIIE family protein phosphatase [Candidatus Riflebacteria bacterium]